MEQRLISIIVAAYNVEKYLDRCIKSLVLQTYPYLEIILVDDGSTDQTGKICDDWVSKDKRISVIHKENGGLSDARNAGIGKANGKWLGFVDGDDYVADTMYEHLYQHRTENGITVCGYQTEKSGNLQEYYSIDQRLEPKEAVDLYLTNELYSICNNKFTYWGSFAWNKLYDSSLFDQISYPIGKKYEDMYVILELVQRSKCIQFIPNCEYFYVHRSDSITNDFTNIVHDSLQARLFQKEQLFKYWQITDSRINKILACEYFSILYRYACLSPKARREHQETALRAWNELQKQGYDHFSTKMKVKLFFFVHCPGLYYLMRKWAIKIKG